MNGGLVRPTFPDTPAAAGVQVEVPPGAVQTAVTFVTGIDLNPIPPQQTGEAGISETVFFGPPGTVFNEPVTITLPFDPEPFGDDFSTLRVYRRVEDGTVTLVPPLTYAINGADGEVSFPVTGFSSYRVFGGRLRERGTVEVELENTPMESAAFSLYGLTYHPSRRKYYSLGYFLNGNTPGLGPFSVWDESGTLLATGSLPPTPLPGLFGGYSFVGVAYNQNSGEIEAIDANQDSLRVYEIGLDENDVPDSAPLLLSSIAAEPGGVALDGVANRLYSHRWAHLGTGGVIDVTSRLGGGRVGEITLDMAATGYAASDLQRSFGFADDERLLVMLVPVDGTALVFELNGDFVGEVDVTGLYRIGSPDPDPDPNAGVTYANGLLFLHDSSGSVWRGVRIFSAPRD